MPLYQHQYVGHTATGETWNFSWWADSTLGIEAEADAAVTWGSTFWLNGYDALTPASVGIDGVNVREITPATGLQIRLAERALELPGVAVGSALPADCAVVVSLRTDLANRRGRGRFYLPQPAVGTVTADGRITQTAVDAIIAVLGTAFTEYAALGNPVVYSRTNRQFTTITRMVVGDLFDTQRRRENKTLESRTSAVMPQ